MTYRIDPRRYPLDFAKCGTAANYRAHTRRGEKPCLSCRQAESRRCQDKSARQQADRYRQYRVKRALQGREPLDRAQWEAQQAVTPADPWLTQFARLVRAANFQLNVERRWPRSVR